MTDEHASEKPAFDAKGEDVAASHEKRRENIRDEVEETRETRADRVEDKREQRAGRVEERRKDLAGEIEHARQVMASDLEDLSLRRMRFVTAVALAAALIAIAVAISSFVIARRVNSNSSRVTAITCVTIKAYKTAAVREHKLSHEVGDPTTRAAHRKSADAIDKFVVSLGADKLHCKP